MKKISIFVAAFAMIAFAGCKKENDKLTPDANGMVTINLTGENCTNSDKQVLQGPFNRIMFQNGERIYFNGIDAYVQTTNQSGILNGGVNSFFGRFAVPASAIVTDNVVFYPADIFNPGVDDTTYSDWTVFMSNDIDIIPITSGEEEITGKYYQAWPMSCLGQANISGKFMMRNCVAIMSPSVKYGVAFIYQAALRGDFPTESIDINITENDLPELRVEEVVFNSNVALAGSAHLEYIKTDSVQIKMDEGGDNTLIARMLPQYLINAIPPSGGIESIIGNIPTAPMVAGDSIQMTAYFTLTFHSGTPDEVIYYGRYRGNNVALADRGSNSIVRNQRTTMCMNLFDGSDTHMSQIKIQSSPF